MSSIITITDVTGTSGSVTDVDEAIAVDTIRGWYPDAPADVKDALVELQRTLDRGEYTGALEAFLGIRIDR